MRKLLICRFKILIEVVKLKYFYISFILVGLRKRERKWCFCYFEIIKKHHRQGYSNTFVINKIDNVEMSCDLGLTFYFYPLIFNQKQNSIYL